MEGLGRLWKPKRPKERDYKRATILGYYDTESNENYKFTDLDAWQEAQKLVVEIYKITQDFPRNEIYGLTSQLRRAAVSITANIAEGFSRFHYKERTKFYYDARGSLSEVQSELLSAQAIGFLKDKEKFDIIWAQTEKVHLILNGLIRKTSSLIKNS